MPAPPEIRHGDGSQRIIEIFIIMKAEHVPHADRHVAVGAKVKIELQGKAERAEPCGRDARLRSAQYADLLPQGASLVCDEHFLEQSHHKTQEPVLKSRPCELPVVELLLDVGKAHDRTCHQLREHGHVCQVRGVAVFRLHLAAVQVYDITHGLERIKADADRKVHTWPGKLRAEQSVDGYDGKVGILEKGKYGQIDTDAAAQEKDPPAAGSAKALHEPPVRVVKRGGKEHQKNVQRFPPRIKNKAENKQNPIFP